MATPATESYSIDWLQRDRHVIDGLDHLGIEVVSVKLYTLLLPGITNVTDRARYYAFYPWVLHRYAQSPGSKGGRTTWLTWLRALDYAYAAASAAYERADDTPASLATAVVGVDKARRVLNETPSGSPIDLKTPAMLDDAGKVPSGAYFKNPEGGLGQYYKGALEVLGILRYHPELRYPDRQLTNFAGRPVAEYLDGHDGFRNLLEVAQAGQATAEELATVGRKVAPSSIEAGSPEEEHLRRLFLGDDHPVCQGQDVVARLARRRSLNLLLDFAAKSGSGPKEFLEQFRWASTERALPDGTNWDIPSGLHDTVQSWAAYQRNDLLNYALESLFWVALHRVDDVRESPKELAGHLANLAQSSIPASRSHDGAPSIDGNVAGFLSACKRSNGERLVDPWGSDSTRQWVANLDQAVSKKDLAATAGWSVRILGRLAADHNELVTRPLGIHAGIELVERSYEVHIGAWLRRSSDRRLDPVGGFLEDLILEWILFRHLRVATRKLASQGVSTFKFRPELGELVLVAEKIPKPTLTSPRITQSRRILEDLKLISVKDQTTKITPDGKSVLENMQ